MNTFKLRRQIDFFLPIIFMFFAILWFVQSIYTLIAIANPFSAIHLLLIGFPMHLSTSLNLCAIYLVNYLFFRTFLLGHLRVIRALLFTTLVVFFYDLVWSICNITINGYGSFILPLVSTLIVVMYLVIFHKKQNKILSFHWRIVVPLIALYATTLIIFVHSGFFQQFALMEKGLATDPHSWQWLLNKTVTLWMWFIIALR